MTLWYSFIRVNLVQFIGENYSLSILKLKVLRYETAA